MPRLLPNNREHGWAPYVWLVFLAFFLFQPILDHASATEWIITGMASAVFLLLYFGIFWVKPPATYLLLIAMAAMGVGLANYNVGSSVFIIFAASFIPWVAGSSRRAMAALALLILVIGIDAVLFHPQPGFWATSIVVALGVAGSNIHFAEKNRADAKLRMAQEEIEHLAKVAERERIARDLHDVLGHTLSLIIVKSTLAGKLLEKYPQKAKQEIADIEKASREAMAEIRGTLRGYATYKLGEEIRRAGSTLNSSGIALQSKTVELNMSPAEESVVALIVREAVTNVVRHSHARKCRLELAAQNGSCVLSVEDDGCGGIHAEGNGLRGMRERIEALGGTLVRDTKAGTRLRFEFPLAVSGNGTH
jgi:two-component system, NarL family, sensor histidine kinase DesK